jgi:hypothetical protein
MRPLTFILLLLAVASLACGKRGDLEHRVRNYEVVQEGSASGVTTSLGGEQAGSVPMTATNLDTTTDLALIPGGPGETAVTTTTPGSLAGTLEIDPAAPPGQGNPPGGGRPPARSVERRRASPEPRGETPPRETPPAEPAPAPAEPPPAEQSPPPTSTTPTTTATQPEEAPPPTNTAPPPASENPGASGNRA